MQKTYEFSAPLWLWKDSWHFISVPVDIGKDIDFYFAQEKRGFGSLKVLVQIGKTEWNTSIFPDKEHDSYFLPIKAAVRKSEGLKLDVEVSISLTIL